MAKNLARLPGYRFAKAIRDLFAGGDKRTSALLQLSSPDSMFQPFGDTAVDRYPQIFAALKTHLGDGGGLRFLSFGCSTGEEVFTLRRYFPDAIIRGLDISSRRIAIARDRLCERADDPRLTRFDVAPSADEEPEHAYDAVLAMAVFRHGDLADGRDLNTLIDFDAFDRALSALARTVRPGGYLALRHSNFRLSDSAVAADFEPVLSETNITPNYGRDGRLLPHVRLEPCLFRKTARSKP